MRRLSSFDADTQANLCAAYLKLCIEVIPPSMPEAEAELLRHAIGDKLTTLAEAGFGGEEQLFAQVIKSYKHQFQD